MINLNSLTKNIKDGFKAPTGDSNRETPTKGALRFNTETGKPEIYAKGRGWRRASVSEISAIYTHDNLVVFYDASNADTTGDTSDQYYSDASLLLHMNGTDGSTTFTDSSSEGRTVTANGNAAISTSQFKFGGSSAYFDGSDFLSTSSSSGLAFGTSDFTVETWVYVTAEAGYGNTIVRNNNGSWASNGWTFHSDHPSSQSKFSFWVYNIVSDGPIVESTTSVSLNTWYHVALTRSGSTFRLFVNGTLEDSYSSSSSVDSNSSAAAYIGGSSTNDSYALTGYLDELRVTKGVARYTSNFTPQTREFYPSTALGNIATTNDYSSYSAGGTLQTTLPKYYKFDGSSDQAVGFPYGGSDFPIGSTTSYTFVFWARIPTDIGNDSFSNGFISSYIPGSADSNWFGLGFYGGNNGSNSGKIRHMQKSGSTLKTITSSIAYNDDTWHQFSFVADSTNMYLYIDADLIGSTSRSGGSVTTAGQLWPFMWDNSLDGNRYTVADLAIFKFYDSALSEADITSEFNYHKSTFGL